jgi:predicted membrane protein
MLGPLYASGMVTLSALIRKEDGVACAATRIEAIAACIPTGLTTASYSGRNVEAS